MPLVKMLKPMFAYPDGIHRKQYDRGETYQIDDENILMAIFNEGAGEIVEEKKTKPKAAPENKASKPKETK